MNESIDNSLSFIFIGGTRFGLITKIFESISLLNDKGFNEYNEIYRKISVKYPNADLTIRKGPEFSQRARYSDAVKLSKIICEIQECGKLPVIVSHSHGGNVALQAVNLSSNDNVLLITLGTPFIEILKERANIRIGLLLVSLPIFLLIFTFAKLVTIILQNNPASLILWIDAFLASAIAIYCIVEYDLADKIMAWCQESRIKLNYYYNGTHIIKPILMLSIIYNNDKLIMPALNFSKKILRERWFAESHMENEKYMPAHQYLYQYPIIKFVFMFLCTIIMGGIAIWLDSSTLMITANVLITLTALYVTIAFMRIVIPGLLALIYLPLRATSFLMNWITFSPKEHLLIACRACTVPVNPNLYPIDVCVFKHESGHSKYKNDPEIFDKVFSWIDNSVKKLCYSIK